MLAKFGLGAEHVVRPAERLSPGERTRAILATLMGQGVNCLVLDEPTNHLDLPAIEQLEEALDRFEGTLSCWSVTTAGCSTRSSSTGPSPSPTATSPRACSEAAAAAWVRVFGGMKIYTRKGDDGTTGLLYGGRVAKDNAAIEANGAVDEAQAAMGLARSEVERGSELDTILVGLERDLYVLMAELATLSANRAKLTAGGDPRDGRHGGPPRGADRPADPAVPAGHRVRRSPGTTGSPPASSWPAPSSGGPSGGPSARRPRRREVLPYLNRLSDLLWTMARWQERGESLPSRQAGQVPTGG